MSNNFEFGKMRVFESIPTSEVVDVLASFDVFPNVGETFTNKLKELLPIFCERLEYAFNSGDENSFYALSMEPKNKLKVLWKVNKSQPNANGKKSEKQRLQETAKSEMQTMYYCLYAILFYRHRDSFQRYSKFYLSKSDFESKYGNDPDFPSDRLATDNWDSLYHFRNLVILASALKTSTRNKGLFCKIGSILAEGRTHAMGGGQSFAADRRGYICDKEGLYFASTQPLPKASKPNFPSQLKLEIRSYPEVQFHEGATISVPSPGGVENGIDSTSPTGLKRNRSSTNMLVSTSLSCLEFPLALSRDSSFFRQTKKQSLAEGFLLEEDSWADPLNGMASLSVSSDCGVVDISESWMTVSRSNSGNMYIPPLGQYEDGYTYGSQSIGMHGENKRVIPAPGLVDFDQLFDMGHCDFGTFPPNYRRNVSFQQVDLNRECTAEPTAFRMD